MDVLTKKATFSIIVNGEYGPDVINGNLELPLMIPKSEVREALEAMAASLMLNDDPLVVFSDETPEEARKHVD